MVRKIENLVIFLLLVMSVTGNNIRSGSTVEIVSVAGDTALLQFDLQWDNSWRDAYNWDAAWIFLKYKEAGGDWQPVYLGESGHSFTGNYSCMPGKSGANIVGLYVHRSTIGAGNVSTTCRLKWKLPVGLTQEKFKTNKAFIMAQGVEMVLVPYGAYYLGDRASTKSFVDANGNSVLIDSEVAQGLKIKEEATAINLVAAYPKGYKGFYIMKYELGQEQYVAFLNTLTFAQQAERVQGLATMKQGDYIFGDRTKPNNRNGIIVNVPSTSTAPAIFANNLNNDDKYNQPDDGKAIACNYMTPEDLHTYCSWSGLRPMSELEYEKASRTPYPETPKAGEYAWNDNATPIKASAVNNGGLGSERPTSGNVNAGNLLEGPVRSGSFAKSGSSQVQAGATYWGVMEMSGNVKELCVNATGTLDASASGSGIYNKAVSGWSSTPAHYGVRGGGFSSADEPLRTSDRTAMTGSAERDSTVGFRGVGVLNASTLSGGTLTAPTTGCAGVPLEITGTPVASTTPVSYQWYVKVDGGAYELIANEADVNLTYDLVNIGSLAVTYTFQRKAFSAIGEGLSDAKSVAVTNAAIKLTSFSTKIDPCGYAVPIVASSVMSGATVTYTWNYNGSPIPGVSGATYIPFASHFGNQSGNYTVSVSAVVNGCNSEKSDLLVSVEEPAPQTFVTCGDAVLDCEGNSYPTLQIGSQCWMVRNLNIGTVTGAGSGNYWKFDEPGIQKWCYGGSIIYCDTYGGLYEWWETVCGGQCNGNVTPVNAQGLTFVNNEADLATYGAVMVQGTNMVRGICPDGWHIPSDTEWRVLGFNKKGWGGLLGGMLQGNGNGFSNLGSYSWWWSSTPIGSSNAWDGRLTSTVVDTQLGHYSDATRSYGFSVRCLLN